ncbi:hypothetical protein A6R68_05363, partial [Neotoma lepida]
MLHISPLCRTTSNRELELHFPECSATAGFSRGAPRANDFGLHFPEASASAHHPEQEEVKLAPVGEGEDGAADIQDRTQALRLHVPDPPLESEDEDEEGAAALSSHSSIPLDPEHVELVKRTMGGVSLPAPGVPAWAREISDA